tara:strand:+ start:534 stop:644 length:111 start_codon:yes stop_codon:yes gene_type:complete
MVGILEPAAEQASVVGPDPAAVEALESAAEQAAALV